MRNSLLWLAKRYRPMAILMAAALVTSCSQDTGQVGKPVDDSAVQVLAFNSAEAGWAAILPAFTATAEGSGITLAPSFRTSGEQLDAVLAGAGADIVHFANQLDMSVLAQRKLVSPDWNSGPVAGVPCGSLITWVVRKGNPRHIADWNDLLKPGLEVMTPNPTLVGSGRWALLAGYAAASDGNQDPPAGEEYLRRLILEHVVVGPDSVTAATDEFDKGRGDVLLLSEAAAMNLQRQGRQVDYIVPPSTLRMDFPVAVLSTSRHKDAATRAVQFLFSDPGQRVWAQQGYRPTNSVVAAEFAAQFPIPQRLWTIADLGGWDRLGPRFFDTTNGTVTKLFYQATR